MTTLNNFRILKRIGGIDVPLYQISELNIPNVKETAENLNLSKRCEGAFFSKKNVNCVLLFTWVGLVYLTSNCQN